MRKTLSILSLFIIMFLVSCDGFIINTSLTSDEVISSIEDTDISTEEITTEEISTEIQTIEVTDELVTYTDEPTTIEATSEESTFSTDEPTTIEPTTEEATTNMITTNNNDQIINDLYEQLQSHFPVEISSDHLLPLVDLEGLTVQYYHKDKLITDGIIRYTAQSFSETLEITVLITSQDLSKSFNFNIVQVRDESLYQEELINTRFNDAYNFIRSNIPNVIYSDITLPTYIGFGIEVTYEVNKSYILDQRFIFTFPENDDIVQLSVNIKYNQEVRTMNLEFTMSAYNNLPKIPEIHINTINQQSIDSKEEYVTGYLSLYEFDENNQATLILDGVSMNIKLRGNSTFFMAKKPYKIKFDEKQYMFGDYQEKDWVLLANFADQTLIRNALAFQMADDLNMEFAPMGVFVDVYVNGVFQGNYLLTDQIEVTNDRVDIEENVPAIDTGYLIEFDKRIYDEGLETTDENYFIIDGIPFVIKSPDIKDAHYSHNQYIYINNYMQEVFNTLKNKEDYSGLIDEATFIDWFIVNEVFKNVDSGYSSVYYYKDTSGLLKMGPIWDFDLSSGNYGHLQEDLRGYEGWYTSRSDKNILFTYLMEYDSFRLALKNRWNEVYDSVIISMVNSIYPMADSMAKSRYDNFNQWNIIGSYQDWFTSPEILALSTYEEQLEFLREFLFNRVQWLNTEINKFNS